MNQKTVPELDWVNAFSGCSLGKVFHQLKLQIAEDVKARNGQIQSLSVAVTIKPYAFAMTEQGERFSVFVEGDKVPRGNSVSFALEEKKICVTDANGALLFEATLTLNDEGECRLKVGGQEREFWQVRRMALQKLFFETV